MSREQIVWYEATLKIVDNVFSTEVKAMKEEVKAMKEEGKFKLEP